jgi:hypothetical protein
LSNSDCAEASELRKIESTAQVSFVILHFQFGIIIPQTWQGSIWEARNLSEKSPYPRSFGIRDLGHVELPNL